MLAFGALWFLFLLAVGLTQAVIGFIGIEHYLGSIAAFLALAAAIFLRLMLPLTIGTFFGALEVFGWPWYLALLITAPGLLLAVPAMVALTIDGVLKK